MISPPFRNVFWLINEEVNDLDETQKK